MRTNTFSLSAAAVLVLALALGLTACGKKPDFPTPGFAQPTRFYPDPALDPQPTLPPSGAPVTPAPRIDAPVSAPAATDVPPRINPYGVPRPEDLEKPVGVPGPSRTEQPQSTIPPANPPGQGG